MNIPSYVKPTLWGAVAGAAALAVVGFSWGGWTTAGSAEKTAQTRANSAVVAALTPICLVQFHQAADSTVKWGSSKRSAPTSKLRLSRRPAGQRCPEARHPAQGLQKLALG